MEVASGAEVAQRGYLILTPTGGPLYDSEDQHDPEGQRIPGWEATDFDYFVRALVSSFEHGWNGDWANTLEWCAIPIDYQIRIAGRPIRASQAAWLHLQE